MLFPGPVPMQRRRILALLPIPYSDGGGFWFRDLGLLVRTLRAMGHDAWLVTLPMPHGEGPTSHPVLPTSRAELESPEWWKAQAPEAVISNTWGAGQYAPMRVAALSATNRLVEKLDTDGLRSPRVWFSQYIIEHWSWLVDDRRYAGLPALALGHAIARALILYAFPALLDRPMALGMADMPTLAVESPIAAQRMRDFIGLFAEKVPPVEVVAHPVDLGDLEFPAEVERQRRVIAVGRWDAHQKDFPLLLCTLGSFLVVRADWTATIVGRLPADSERLLSELPPAVRSRISFPGALPHAELAPHLYASRILLVTSRHESFHIAAAEALCCGCSVVGPVEIASMPWFVGSDSGTVSSRRSERFLAQALQVEARLWDAGARDPERIASVWRLRVGSRVIVERLLELLFPPDST